MKRSRHKGSILLAVMVTITLAALVGTTVLYRADALRGSASTAMEHAQLRSLAWSGVQGAMAELSSQRDSLLQGGEPTLTSNWNLFIGTVHGNIRLETLGPKGAVVVSEGGKLDLNMADAKMLAKLPGVGEALAGKIVGARGAGFASAGELGGVEGVSAKELVGPAGDDEDKAGGGAGEGTADAGNAGDAPAPASLLGLTTVFSFDPNTAAGIKGGAEVARLNVSGGWTEDMTAVLKDRMSDGAAGFAQTMLKAGSPAHDSDLVAGLRQATAPVEVWGEVLDGLTTSNEAYRRGRVDLNSAPAEVLACVPGIDQTAAEKIVDARAGLDAVSRQKVTWPLKEGILKEDQFQTAVDWITTRSLQWRVRVEARMVHGEAGANGSRQDDVDQTPPGMVWEAVIDVSGAQARVAYLRDVTYLSALAQRARNQAKTGVGSEPGTEGDSGVPSAAGAGRNQDAGSASSGPGAGATPGKSGTDSGLSLEGMNGSGTLNMDSGLKMQGDSDGPLSAPDQTGSSPPPAPKDSRIGRWRGP